VLQVNDTPVINPVLEVGLVNEQVEVQANAALVETRRQGIGRVMENQTEFFPAGTGTGRVIDSPHGSIVPLSNFRLSAPMEISVVRPSSDHARGRWIWLYPESSMCARCNDWNSGLRHLTLRTAAGREIP
jgi:hypothetical protein